MKWIIDGKNIFYENGVTCVATVHDSELTEKHAHLIKSAPVLLSAAKEALNVLLSEGIYGSAEISLMEAIKEASGE